MANKVSEDIFGFLETCINDSNVKKAVNRITISNQNIEVQVISYGATITSLKVLDKENNRDDIVLGFDDLLSYTNHNYYFGCTVGRFANRIARGHFKLRDNCYNLALNNGLNHLHGGIKGFDKVIWDYSIHDGAVTFTYVSASMEENYPGQLTCHVTYMVTLQSELLIEYRATTTDATPINLTNHSYFNLGGHGSGTVYDHIININANHYTPVDSTSIPTGEIVPVDNSPLDLKESKDVEFILSKLPDGIDHNFCINGNPNSEKYVASVYHPKSGRLMKVFSTQPGVQIYTGNFLPTDDSLIGKDKKNYKKHSAICLETQNYPDSINHPNFPKAVLEVEEVYHHTTKYQFSIK